MRTSGTKLVAWSCDARGRRDEQPHRDREQPREQRAARRARQTPRVRRASGRSAQHDRRQDRDLDERRAPTSTTSFDARYAPVATPIAASRCEDGALLDDLARGVDRAEPDRDRHEQEQQLRGVRRASPSRPKTSGSKERSDAQRDERHLRREDERVAPVAGEEPRVAARRGRDLVADGPRWRARRPRRAGARSAGASGSRRRAPRSCSARHCVAAYLLERERRCRRSARAPKNSSASSGLPWKHSRPPRPITITLSQSAGSRVACVTSTTGRAAVGERRGTAASCAPRAPGPGRSSARRGTAGSAG